MLNKEIIKSAIFGLSCGDCLGVPVEFLSRNELKANPVKDMREFGTYYKPKGTWSDDTSLSLATLDGLTENIDLSVIANNFVQWKYFNKYCQDKVFDIGNTTSRAIAKINLALSKNEFSEDIEYGGTGTSNGNGSLMRMIPVALYLYIYKDKYDSLEKRREFVYKLSALTHATLLCKNSCHIYVEYALLLLKGYNKYDAFSMIIKIFKEEVNSAWEFAHFKNLLSEDFKFKNEKDISGSGFVIDSLYASLWCLLTTDNYSSCVLKAVNLGEDTDTTACIVGGLAGILYGINNEKGIPQKWIDNIYKKTIIEDIIDNFCLNNNIMK